MLKTEIICEACSTHYIIVSQDDSEPLSCPFCTTPISVQEELDMGEDE